MLTFKSNKNRFYDKLHRSVVSVLIGLTVVGSAIVGYEYYHWWYVYRPQVKEAHKQELLIEGKSDSEEYTERRMDTSETEGLRSTN